jgi:endonuclease YncB( thermonuclease family)
LASADQEMRYTCKGVVEGDYYVSVLGTRGAYFGFFEVNEPRTFFFLNDTLLQWSGVTAPYRLEGAPEGSDYLDEMLAGKVHVKPDDVFRVAGANTLMGSVRLYRQSPPVASKYLNPPDAGKVQVPWLYMDWTESKRVGDTVSETCKLVNPGVLPRTFTLQTQARDYFMRDLLGGKGHIEEITIAPGQSATKTFEFKPGDTKRARLNLVATCPGNYFARRLSKFWVNDITQGPRPNMLISGEWEYCFAPGAEPAGAPPAGAQWRKINLPANIPLQQEPAGENLGGGKPTTLPAKLPPPKDRHCAWFRKIIDAPAYLAGERAFLKCNEVMSVATVYVNGQMMGAQKYAMDPFEIDITNAFKAGQKNEILIGVQDWLAYSPRNRDRVAHGEEPIFKDGMIDVADYDTAEFIGIRGPLWIETRPAVYVADVAVTTSVRNKKLTLTYRLANATGANREVTLQPQILDAGLNAKTLDEKKVTVPDGQTVCVTVEQDWPEAKCWWPNDPHLYVLQTTLGRSDGPSDTHIQRFGFREFWIDGYSFILNGTRVKLRSCCIVGATGKYAALPFWEEDKRLAAIWDWQTACRDDRYLQLVRTHLWSRFDEGLEMADEDGVMVKLETGFHQQRFTLDKRFWENATGYEKHEVNVYKNHASIMLWSGGNENMWGIIYQGEVAKDYFNDWQIKAANAMQETDPMHRPAEFEADGDLLGGGKYYALHYPRELSAFPALPNDAWWGPLDGKTVIPYSMGPITLGTKPLTVGESCDDEIMNHPFGETIMEGDKAYEGAIYLTAGWMEPGRFFLNGFRDVEFALTDTFVPLAILKPQKVVLEEEAGQFYGGQTIERRVNVHNDIFCPAKLTLRTSLVGADGKILIKGSETLSMSPAQLKRMVLDTHLPSVSQPTDATWRVELLDGEKVLDVQERAWRLYPTATLKTPPGRKIALFDPPGKTADVLKKLGVSFDLLPSLEAIPQDAALLVGEDALKQPPAGQWREAIAAYVRKGGKAAILAQVDALESLPVPLTQTKLKATIAFVRAGDHPVMAGLTDDDLRWWAPDHYVSTGNFRKPTSGNWLPLADAGTMEGPLETPLLEEYDGSGSYLICQFLMAGKAGIAPQATRLMQNILDYLASPKCFRVGGATALLAGTNKPLRTALDAARLSYEDLTGKLDQLNSGRFTVAIVDAAGALDAGMVAPLQAFAQSGGRVMIFQAAPTHQGLIEGLLGIHLRFSPIAKEPGDTQNRFVRTTDSGLLAGISNHEFFWASDDYLKLFRRVGWWWADCGPRPKEEYIVDYYCQPVEADRDKAAELTRPCALLQVPAGKGCFIVNQLRIDHPISEAAVTASRLDGLLLTNLGCRIVSEGGGERARLLRLASYQFTPIDLGPYCNRGLRDDKAAGIVGWSNQGENDMRAFKTGQQALAGVLFNVAAGKSAIGLYSLSGMGNTELPKDVKGIKVGCLADRLFFLHVASYLLTSKEVCSYRVNYSDGSGADILIENGKQIFDWWNDPVKYADDLARNSAFVAWRGDNPMHKGLVALGYEWVNPNPEKQIASVDFATRPKSEYEPAVFLLGLTAATVGSNEGVVEDIIGTQGVKVRIGNQLKDIYYIGSAGIDKSNAYYEKALAAHRAMVVGQKVTVLMGEVPKTSDGKTLAYVCLGKDTDVRNMLNSKVIGEGLAKVGNFEGNGKHQMFLANLGFITEQNKKGMWEKAK